MKTEIDPKRNAFWRYFLNEFEIDCKNRFTSAPSPFKRTQQTVYDQIVADLTVQLDRLLTPTIVSFIQENKINATLTSEVGTPIYDGLFSGNHERTRKLLESFHSQTFINILNRCKRFKLHFFQLTQRVFEDWSEIKRAFCIDDTAELTHLELSCGDEHFHGGQTSIFLFNQRYQGFVYKPVSISIDILLQELKTTINKNKRNKLISKSSPQGDYGYIGLHEYVSAVDDLKKAEGIYEEFGQLLAWGKFFKIADGHANNIIVSTTGVQWIDAESAFHFINDPLYTRHPLEETGLICEAKPENTYTGIVTGIQAGSIPRLRLTSPTVYCDGSDEMFIRYFKAFIPERSTNRFFLNGVLCQPEAFSASIQKGYRDGLQRLVKQREELLGIIKEFFKYNTIRCRYLLQPTVTYSRFLGLLHHIMAVRKGDVLAHIRAERSGSIAGSQLAIHDFIIENELIDLVNGVIPYFYRTNTDNSLYHACGAFRGNFFHKSLFQEIEDHVMRISLDPDAFEEDCRFIQKALDSTSNVDSFEAFKEKFHSTFEPAVPGVS